MNIIARRLLCALVILFFASLLIGCEEDDQAETAAPDGSMCDPTPGDWEQYVMAPGSDTLYPAGLTLINANGEGRNLNPELLGPDGKGVRIDEGEALIIDMGQEVGGFAEIALNSDNYFAFNLHFSETIEYLFNTKQTFFEKLTALAMPFVWLPKHHSFQTKGEQTIEDPQQVGGFRWIMLKADHGSAKISGFTVRFTPYRTTPDLMAGYFLSDDDLLNRIWYAGVYTLDVNTIRPWYGETTCDTQVCDGDWCVVDGAKRDRLVWAGDLYVAAKVSYASRSDNTPVEGSLDYLAEFQRDDGALPGSSPVGLVGMKAYSFLEYDLFWVLAAWDNYIYTADGGALLRRYDVVKAALGYVGSKEEYGLVRVDSKDAGTWAWSIPRRGYVTFVNVLYVMALERAAAMADELGFPEDAEIFRFKAVTTERMVRKCLFDPQRMVFFDSSEDDQSAPLDANAVAILSGVAGWRADGIVSYIEEHMAGPFGDVNVAPEYERTQYGLDFHNRRAIGFVNYFDVAARFEVGDDEGALDLIRQCWGYMLLNGPQSTFWEFIGPIETNGLPEMSYVGMAHPWSAGATSLLTERVLGVKPTSPGFATFDLEPHMGGLRHVEGRVPTPYGPINVKLDADPYGLKGYIEVPQGTIATFHPPDWLDASTLVFDQGGASEEGDDWVALGPGEHCFMLGASKGD